MVVYVTDHRCFSSQGDWRLAYPWLWWSSFEVLSNFVVVIYYITIWKWVNSNKLFFFYKVLVESFSTNLTWFLFPSMLQFLSFVIIYAVEWCLSVCSVSVLEKFLVESRKRLEIALILHYFALWLVQKTHATNQSDAKLKPITTWSPAFSRALVTLVVFNLNSRCLFKVFFFFLIGCRDYLTYVSSHSVENRCINQILLNWWWLGSELTVSLFFPKIYFIVVVHSYIKALREDPSGASVGFSPPLTGVNQTQMVITFPLF